MDKKAKDSGIVFCGATLLPVIISYLFYFVVALTGAENYSGKTWFTLCSYLMTQLALFLTVVCYGKFFDKKGLFNEYKFEKFNSKILIILPLVFFGQLFGLGFLNDKFIIFLNKIGLKASSVSLSLNTPLELVLGLVIVALLPAINEEVIFRKIILKGLDGKNRVLTVLISALMFSLYHHNAAQTVYQFLIGIIFGYVALNSGSYVPTAILHFLNNAFILVLYYFVPNFVFSNSATTLLIISGVVALIVAFVLMKFILKIKTEKNQEKNRLTTFFVYSLFGIIMCVAQWILGVI